MDTTITISGLPHLGSSILRPNSSLDAVTNKPGGEASPGGLPPLDVQIQAVASMTNSEQSNLSRDSGQSSQEQLSDAVKSMNDFLQMVRRTLEFKLDEDTGVPIILVKDSETKDVIRQIPSDEMLKIAKEMDRLKGLLFESKV